MKLKYFLYCALIFLLFACKTESENSPETATEAKAKTDAQVAETTETSNLESSVVVLQIEEFLDNVPDGGGELTATYIGDEIQEIQVEIGLSYGTITNRYYFENGSLSKVIETEYTFAYNAQTDELDYDDPVVAFAATYNFDNGIFLDSKTEGKRAFSEPLKLDPAHIKAHFDAEVLEYVSKIKMQ